MTAKHSIEGMRGRYIRMVGRRLLSAFADDREAAYCVHFAYQHCLGRPAGSEELRRHARALRAGAPLSALVHELEFGPEAKQRRQNVDNEHAFFVDFLFLHCLGRPAASHELQHFLPPLQNGAALSSIIQSIENSPEATQRRHGSGVLDDLSDGEFVLHVSELFEGRGAVPAFIEHWRKFLAEDRAKRSELVRNFMAAYVAKKQKHEVTPWDPHRCWIMGTDRFLGPAAWQEKAAELQLAKPRAPATKPEKARKAFRHSGNFAITAIASLYNGRKYIETFLDNITSQTIFDQSELIIIDADSPGGEREIIADYQKIFPNIVYERVNYRIGVYEAWNVGVKLARGKYLTNTNVDDLRRQDSFELQANALERNPSVDVVYQDFFYSFDGSLSFEDVARFGFKSEVPIVTANNLLAFNSPHNAPVWRKALHDEVGLFDTSFKSAGDWEFWLRCLSKGKTFLKINTPHVAYFQNPEGISTSPETRGVDEAYRISRRYSPKLISPYLVMSRKAFADALGIAPGWDWNLSYYEVVQGQLRQLADRRKDENMNPGCGGEKLHAGR